MEPTSVIGTKNKKGQVFTDPRIMMREAPRTPSFYTGSEVIKEAIRRASIDVMIAYPITPQSEAAALIGELFAEGYIGDYFRGESEFAVMSQCAGAAFDDELKELELARAESGTNTVRAFARMVEAVLKIQQKTVQQDLHRNLDSINADEPD